MKKPTPVEIFRVSRHLSDATNLEKVSSMKITFSIPNGILFIPCEISLLPQIHRNFFFRSYVAEWLDERISLTFFELSY